MSEQQAPAVVTRKLWFIVLLLALVALAVWLVRVCWPGDQPLAAALQLVINGKDAAQAHAATAILDNFREIRQDASHWSGVYWGFTFAAAALSAIAALILKVESLLDNEKIKKDIAALLSVTAAILVTISTSGDFHRKWQANRIAAAKLERAGYELLANKDCRPRNCFDTIAQILYQRNVNIVGNMDFQAEPREAASKAPAEVVPN